MKVRSRLQEIAEMASLPNMAADEQQALLHIVVFGGGPTGVGISAEMTDLIQNDFSIMYPHLRDTFTITIHDVAPQILSMFDQKLAEHALDSFKRSSVEVKTGYHIIKVEPGALYTEEDGMIRYGMLIWATGNKQVPLVDTLSVSKSNRLPRILTDEYIRPLHVEGRAISNAFAISDAADIKGVSCRRPPKSRARKARTLPKCSTVVHQVPSTINSGLLWRTLDSMMGS
jgi:NADH:ubiquinone reductase (non-electrogenic)